MAQWLVRLPHRKKVTGLILNVFKFACSPCVCLGFLLVLQFVRLSLCLSPSDCWDRHQSSCDPEWINHYRKWTKKSTKRIYLYCLSAEGYRGAVIPADFGKGLGYILCSLLIDHRDNTETNSRTHLHSL